MLQKLGFLPGFNKQVTSTGAESQWTGGTNVRFRYGTPEKIGGWSQLGDSKLTGAARSLHHMVNKTGIKYSLIGTNRILYAYTGDVYYDIHPLVNPSGTAIRSTIRLPATSTSRGAPKSVQQAHRPGRAGQVGRAPDPEPYDGPRAWNLPKPAVRDVPSDPSRRITYCHEAWEGRQYPVPKTLPLRGGGLQQTTEPRSNPTSQSQSCSDNLTRACDRVIGSPGSS